MVRFPVPETSFDARGLRPGSGRIGPTCNFLQAASRPRGAHYECGCYFHYAASPTLAFRDIGPLLSWNKRTSHALLGKIRAQLPAPHAGEACGRAAVMIDMAANRWRRLRPLLDRAIELEGEQRTAYLRTLRSADPALHDDLERLLAEQERLQGRTLPNAFKLVTRALACDSRDKQQRDDIATSEPTDAIP